MYLRESFWAQVYISVATFACAQAEGDTCACKGVTDGVGGNLCIYQPEPGKKIPTSRYVIIPPLPACPLCDIPSPGGFLIRSDASKAGNTASRQRKYCYAYLAQSTKCRP